MRLAAGGGRSSRRRISKGVKARSLDRIRVRAKIKTTFDRRFEQITNTCTFFNSLYLFFSPDFHACFSLDCSVKNNYSFTASLSKIVNSLTMVRGVYIAQLKASRL